MSLSFLRYKKHRFEIVLFLLIFALGFFLRAYHFSDWLEFEIDQTYDTRIVSQAVEQGPSNLILLGPTAGGGRSLRLGPAFYYLEYASAKIFGNTPPGHAATVLIFSILSLPLFYVFSRLYFSKPISLALLLIFATSFYLVLYSRFSWSPNVLPFLTLLSFYALLRSLSADESKRNIWFLFATAIATLTTQIHFNAFFILPTIIIPFLIYSRPIFNWKIWLAALSIIITIYSPMIFSDIETGGENIGFFVKKVSKGGSVFAATKRKLTQNLQYNASEFLLINTGIDVINGGYIKKYGFQNDSNLKWRVLAIVLLILEISLLIFKIFKEKNVDRKNFLIILFLWFFVSFAYFFSLISNSFHIYPRFFLITSPLSIILSGFILELIPTKRKYLSNIFLVFIVGLLVFSNIGKIRNHFLQLGGNPEYQKNINTEDVFPETGRLTLREQFQIIDYIQGKYNENQYPVYIDAKSEYKSAFWYHLNKLGILYYDEIHTSPIYEQANYFVIQYADRGIKRLSKTFTLQETTNFGILDVYLITPKPEKISALRQELTTQKKLEQVTQISKLLTWKDLFSQQNNSVKH